MDAETDQALRERALDLLEEALALCDRLGEAQVACHVQLGHDLLTQSASARILAPEVLAQARK